MNSAPRRSRAFCLSRRQCLAAVVLFGPAAGLLAQPPADYYDTIDSSSATALRSTLHEVIDDHTRYPYTASTTDTWDILNMADEDPNNTGNILDVYRNASYPKIPGGVGAYNREHAWPKSYGFPNDGSTNYPYTDCHHLFTSDAGYNSSRSNKPYRFCDAGCSENPTLFNDGRGGGSGTYPGNSNWTSGSFSTGTWETWSGRRGDVARAMFYMDLRYEGGIHGVTGISEPDLGLTDDDTLIDAFNTGVNESMAFMGILSDLLIWHELDPVDGLETWRNEVVFAFQGNRNPFIDHPEWVRCIYADECSFDSVPPAAPESLIASALNGGAELSWLPNSETDLAGYNVFRSEAPGGPYGLVNVSLVTGTTYTDFGLVNGTVYYYVVAAVDTSNNEGALSNEASVLPDGSLPDMTPPGAPTGLGATAGDGQVQLSWNANGESDLAGYNAYRSTTSGTGYGKINASLITTTNLLDTGRTNGTTYFYLVTAVDASGNESLDSAEVSATPAALGGGGIVLSEVVYDVSGTDDGLEWVELFNAGTSAVDLSGYSLGNGGTSYTYSVVQLSGIIAPGQAFVVGGPTSNASNGNPAFDQLVNFSPDFQNSGSTADGVALFDVPAGQVNGSTIPVDAVIYGGSNGNGLIDETGAANAPEVGDASAGSSLERIDLAGAWQIQGNPSPNTSPLGSAQNTAPSVEITAPVEGSTFIVGTSVTFTGTATDAEDGSLSASLSWTSNLDGALGTGGSLSTSALSIGSHTISASVTDSGGLSGSASISITVDPVPNDPPVVSLTAPANGSSFEEGELVTFTGTATDAEDGPLSASITWSSSLDGALGSGASVSTTTLSVGSHTISASVTDSGGAAGSDSISLTVTAPVSLGLILSEVFYDASGTDDGLEWVELFNAGSTTVDLSGYSLGNGGTSYTTSLVQLSGSVAPGQIFVVGGPTSNSTNYDPSLDQSVNFNPDFQNSGTTADGVALFNVAAAQVNGSTVPIDAVIYGGSNGNGLIDETGAASAPEVGDAPSGSSIERVDLAGSWQVQSAPTPNASPLGGFSNTAPAVTITAPAEGSSSTSGDSVTFAGTATDVEDGNLSAFLSWSSDLDGALGAGSSISTNALSVGTHTITASVTDSGGLSGTDSITLIVQGGATPVTVTFTSIGPEDGWVRESSENSNVGGARNTTGKGSRAIRPGDGTSDRQYKSILSFDTSSIPAGATVTAATLRLRRGAVRGTNPFSILGSCVVDVQTGGFGGNTSLQNSDFEAAATASSVATMSSPASNGDFSEGSFNAAGLAAINLSGRTQTRVSFTLDDNDDGGDDYMGFRSGDDNSAANHPQLVVTYVP